MRSLLYYNQVAPALVNRGWWRYKPTSTDTPPLWGGCSRPLKSSPSAHKNCITSKYVARTFLSIYFDDRIDGSL